MVEVAADGSVRPRFFDRGFHGGVGMNELAFGVGTGRYDPEACGAQPTELVV
jgi:hypothetical protein